MRIALPIAALAFVVPSLSSQGQNEAQQPPLINQSQDPLLASFRFRSIGPASMGGRIDDIAVSESDPSIIYVGYAVGGVFKSDNNGTTFEPVFETYGTASIGDIAIHPSNPNIVYVGTGEPNNRQTSSFGDGIYKTTDGGKTFTNIGLKETQTIARIVIDPRNPETVYVASPGHLFGPNPERGIFKTTDGGKTWDKVKYIDENSGFTDIAIDPTNTNTLYAASYQRRRSGCCFNGGGPASAIWKTTDAGRSWTKLSGNGLPPGTYGRIALDVSRSNPNVIYAQIEAGNVGQPSTTRGNDPNAATENTPPGAAAVPGAPGGSPAQAGRGAQPAETGRGGGGGGGRGGSPYNWCNNGGPTRGFGGRGGQQAETPEAQRNPPTLDINRGGIFRSENKGAGWLHISNCNSRPMYFSQLRVDPTNEKTIYVAGLPVAKSLDGGKTFATLDDAGGHNDPGHVDQHAIWIDPKNPKHIMIGNDGGLNISYDQGKTWDFVNTMATSLAYWVSADMRRPYYVYTGLQDNGSWGGPSAKRGRGGIMNSDWFGIGGGDGFQTAVDPTDFNVVYTESQDGNTSRYDLRLGRGTSIRPRSAAGGRGGGRGGGGGGAAPATPAPETAEAAPQQAGGGFGGRGGPPNVLNAAPNDQYRFNWNTPFTLSPHNPSIVWLGGNRLFKSYNRGDTWVASGDLTKQIDRNTVAVLGVPGDRTQLSKNDGVVSYSTIISVSESPVMPGVVWAGTDDGNVQVSRDGGVTFTEVGKNIQGLPANHVYWISRIDASHFDPGTAYVSVDGHRDNDLKPYLYVTRDYGKTWQSIAGNLPTFGNIQVVREDPKNRDLLYVGTEFGLFVSLNGGKE
jgi:Sortilin, neurotensin receptor 3,